MAYQKTHQFKAIIFDCDGTLVDSEYAHYLGWQHALQKQGSDLTLEEYYFFVGKSVEANAKLFAEKIGRNTADEILHDKHTYFRALLNEGLPPIKPTVDFVRRIANEKKRLGIRLGVASAAKKPEIEQNLRHLNIEEYFDVVVSGIDDLSEYVDAEGTNKPKPYIYLHAAKLLQVLPSECLVIEDSHPGVCAGINAGCYVVAVPNKFTEQQDLSLAHLKLDSLAGFSIFDKVIST